MSTTRTTDQWWRTAVVYQIYVRSFSDSDGDGLGDLPGITARLPYIADLGADAVWITPFYRSPMHDGGYDVADHRAVDPRFGTLDDADDLIRRAHELGLRVIIDIVPNHTSDQHAWFRKALTAPPGSGARSRYVFRDGRGDGTAPPTDWQSVFGGPAWRRVPDGQWYLHLFGPHQPDLDWSHPEVRADFEDILRFWLDRGVDGFRFDVAHGMAKDLADPLRDLGPAQVHHRIVGDGWQGDHPFWDREDVHGLLRGFRRVTDAYTPPRATVAESWAALDRRALYTRPDELHQAFNFDFLNTPWQADALRATIDRSLALAAGTGAAPTWVLSNHDVVRHASRLALPPGVDPDDWLLTDGRAPSVDPGRAARRARAAALLLLALPGAAYLYQGEELGLPEAADLPADVLQDPVHDRSRGRRKGRDGCRVPLPWATTGPSLGFGPGPAWLPQPASYRPLSVEAQRRDPDSMLALYRRALALRRTYMSAGTGTDAPLRWQGGSAPGILDFHAGNLRCVVNLSHGPMRLPTDHSPLLTSTLADAPQDALLPDEAAWLTDVREE
ncbi:glycoside hydrolase family 13 protein [Streptomyces drozdowiczii]|uniref:Glycoside hydrolase family 13 protein n=1 Tax=Streptomyces drozdowiczii TaxID=202862 RepID=A0ABY6Q1J4_9ACTN|nr:glycoside hydrolase family 13 protein [Streptomyces drozdowiczii]MCX0242009.1 glycoside hydrolase family 13 protein [Streptomyces drozdowiczii]UZK57889.1 glycoside hydrolase family 13 protein [Streptomyces drozdowiczii]